MSTVSTKQFTIAGTSRHNGRTTYRFATGDVTARVTALKRGGHTAIKLNELKKPMTKSQAIAFMAASGTKALLPTRSPDPKYKSPILIAALEKLDTKVKN